MKKKKYLAFKQLLNLLRKIKKQFKHDKLVFGELQLKKTKQTQFQH